MFINFSYACYWDLDRNQTKDYVLKMAISEQVFSENYDKKLL